MKPHIDIRRSRGSLHITVRRGRKGAVLVSLRGYSLPFALAWLRDTWAEHV